jgi:hypothetical protein
MELLLCKLCVAVCCVDLGPRPSDPTGPRLVLEEGVRLKAKVGIKQSDLSLVGCMEAVW